MPTLAHEAPLAVLREEPRLVPALLREVLGIDVPPFAVVDVIDADFTQLRPVEFRADLVLCLRGDGPGQPAQMGIVIELQRRPDDTKQWTWPLYVAALRERLRQPTCLVVVATTDEVARWASEPIELHPGSPFVPLVLGPQQIPRVDVERARREPWLAVLSALAHGNRPGGSAVVRAAFAALPEIEGPIATFCYDVIWASLDAAARQSLEDEMQPGKYEYQSEFARRYFGEGREEGRVAGMRTMLLALLESRLGQVDELVRAQLDAIVEGERLVALAQQVTEAPDADAIRRVLSTASTG